MIKRILAIGLLSYVVIQACFALPKSNFDAVQKNLASMNGISGHFIQLRKIKLLNAPLKSEGTFIFSKKDGLTWQQTKPFKTLLKINGSTLYQKIGNNPPTIFTKKSQPVIFIFAKIFIAAFHGETAALTPYFKIQFSGTTAHWQMHYIAKSPPISKAIQSIHLIGGKYVNQAIIHEASGDEMLIYFSQMKTL